MKNRKQGGAHGKRHRNRKERSSGRREQQSSHCHKDAKSSNCNAYTLASGSNRVFPLVPIQIPFPYCDAHAIE